MASKQKTKAASRTRTTEDKEAAATETTQFTVSHEAPKPDPDRKPIDMQAMPEYGRGRVAEAVRDENDDDETPDKKWTQASKARWGFGDGADVSELNRDSMKIDEQIAEREADGKK